MGHGLNCEFALDECAVTGDGRVAMWDLEELFGDHWRMRGEAEKRLSDFYADLAALYRTFKAEHARRSRWMAGVGVFTFLKQRHGSGTKKTKAVLAQLKNDNQTPTAPRT